MKKKQKFISFLWLSGCLILINFIASKTKLQWDFTSDRFYTLSNESRKIIEEIKKPIQLEFYFSSHIDTPIGFKNFGTRIKQLLQQYAKISSHKISLKVIDPLPGSLDESEALRLGVYAQKVENSENLFFGLAVIQGVNTTLIPLFDYRRESILEYDISKAIVAVQKQDKPTLGVISPLPLFGDPQLPIESRNKLDGTAELEIIQELHDLYDIIEIPYSMNNIPHDCDLLLVVHPSFISQDLQNSISHFIDLEKPAVLLIDPYNYGESIRDLEDGMVIGEQYYISSNLAQLLEKWGLQISSNTIIADFDNPTEVPAYEGAQTVEYPLWISSNDMSDQNEICAGFDKITLANTGYIEISKKQNVHFKPLIKSSTNSGLISIEQIESLELHDFRDATKITPQAYTLAALIEGHPTMTNIHSRFVLIADSDFISNGMAYTAYQVEGQIVTKPRNNNAALLLNALDYLNGNQSLLSLRSKGQTIRPFTTFHQIKQNAEKAIQQEISTINIKLQNISARMNEIQKQYKTSSHISLDQMLILELQKMSQLEDKFIEEKKEINTRADSLIRSQQQKLKILNFIPIPLIIITIGTIYITKRNKRRKESLVK